MNGPEEQALTTRDDIRSISAKVGNEPAKEMGGRILSQHHTPTDGSHVRSTWAKPSLRMRNPDLETELIGSKSQDMAFSAELDVLLDLGGSGSLSMSCCSFSGMAEPVLHAFSQETP